MAAFNAGWCMPCGPSTAEPRLTIYNTLTRTKVPFVPIDPTGRSITMYICGPTVYDASHLGHARTYIQFDVVRRILRDVAGYDVTFVMNVTDVDDKIIMRANERKMSAELLAREWEGKFMEDMASLGIERPDAMPRVTEYMDEIVDYVAKIVANGFAYALEGSVYFDTAAFAAGGYRYGKLAPENVGCAELMAEGEGKLSVPSETTKRDAKDFALWKASKPNEPKWPSPWGEGRPGWHIECSAMIDATIGHGGAIDIHGGGVDLKFPHHDNELAQSEAFCNCGQTVNYFAHTGHLNIKGLKMSKSMKNFITIRQALDGTKDETTGEVIDEGVRASTMRVMYVLTKYNAPCDWSDNVLSGARAVEKKFREYFHNVAAALRPLDADTEGTRQKWGERDAVLRDATAVARTVVKQRLLDDFDTPGAVLALQQLVDATNAYLQSFPIGGAERPVPLVVASAARYVSDSLLTLGVTGLASEDNLRALRFTASASSSAATATDSAQVAPLLDVLAAFRDDVRAAARGGDTRKVLELCDALRDDALPELGVRLEDRGAGSVWKLDEPAALRAEKAQKLADAAAKEEAKVLEAAKKAAKEAAASVEPSQLFKTAERAAAFSAWDAEGVPTHDAAGEALPKTQIKKLRKEFEKQVKLHEKAAKPAAAV